MDYRFFIQSLLFGIGLAMDACAVSMVNGFNEPKMKISKCIVIAIFFGLFQALMPLIGYFIGNNLLQYIEKYIPIISLFILSFLGIKMIYESIKKIRCGKNENDEDTLKQQKLTFITLLIQSIATSIDALSVGVTIANYTLIMSLVCALIIAVSTFILSFISVFIGKKFGVKLGSKAEILGGIILISIGLEIFFTGIF